MSYFAKNYRLRGGKPPDNYAECQICGSDCCTLEGCPCPLRMGTTPLEFNRFVCSLSCLAKWIAKDNKRKLEEDALDLVEIEAI